MSFRRFLLLILINFYYFACILCNILGRSFFRHSIKKRCICNGLWSDLELGHRTITVVFLRSLSWLVLHYSLNHRLLRVTLSNEHGCFSWVSTRLWMQPQIRVKIPRQLLMLSVIIMRRLTSTVNYLNMNRVLLLFI